MKNRINLSSQKITSFQIKRYCLIKTLVLVLGIFLQLPSFAQNAKSIKGVVVDEGNNPIPGATVILKGSKSVGTVSGADGNFSLDIPSIRDTNNCCIFCRNDCKRS